MSRISISFSVRPPEGKNPMCLIHESFPILSLSSRPLVWNKGSRTSPGHSKNIKPQPKARSLHRKLSGLSGTPRLTTSVGNRSPRSNPPGQYRTGPRAQRPGSYPSHWALGQREIRVTETVPASQREQQQGGQDKLATISEPGNCQANHPIVS